MNLDINSRVARAMHDENEAQNAIQEAQARRVNGEELRALRIKRNIATARLNDLKFELLNSY